MKVINVSLSASEQDIKEFFSFSGDIEYIEMKRLFPIFLGFLNIGFSFSINYSKENPCHKHHFSENERAQNAFVTFKEPQGAETAVLLSVYINLDYLVHNSSQFIRVHSSTFWF